MTEDTSLSTGAHWTISDDDAGSDLHGANRHCRLIRHVQHRHRWRWTYFECQRSGRRPGELGRRDTLTNLAVTPANAPEHDISG
ncbi:hypothetical protein OH492_25110 [Vibrio chagasii]|nr:hypothetical protein [Vibrio chagasii]